MPTKIREVVEQDFEDLQDRLRIDPEIATYADDYEALYLHHCSDISYRNVRKAREFTTHGKRQDVNSTRLTPEDIKTSNLSKGIDEMTETDEIRQANQEEHRVRFRQHDFPFETYIDSILTWVNDEDIKALTQLWYNHIVHGSHAFYPKSREELNYYQIVESKSYKIFIDATALFLLCSAMALPLQCLYRDGDRQNVIAIIGSINLVCCLIQLLDLRLRFLTTNWKKTDELPNYEAGFLERQIGYVAANHIELDQSIFWQQTRFVCLILLLINTIIHMSDVHVPNISRILIPIVFIVRFEDLKQLIQGLFHSSQKIAKLLIVMVGFLLVWAFVGFCFLRRYAVGQDAGEVRFNTFGEALYACLHCTLSRPTVLYRLNPIFSDNNYSSFYFMVLTLIGDIMLTTLIISMGTRAFKKFSLKNLQGRLVYRYQALHSIYLMYAKRYSLSNKLHHVTIFEDEEKFPRSNTSTQIDLEGWEKKRFEIDFCWDMNTWMRFAENLEEKFRVKEVKDQWLLFYSEAFQDDNFNMIQQSTSANLEGSSSNGSGKKPSPMKLKKKVNKQEKVIFEKSFFRLNGLISCQLSFLSSSLYSSDVLQELNTWSKQQTQSKEEVHFSRMNSEESISSNASISSSTSSSISGSISAEEEVLQAVMRQQSIEAEKRNQFISLESKKQLKAESGTFAMNSLVAMNNAFNDAYHFLRYHPRLISYINYCQQKAFHLYHYVIVIEYPSYCDWPVEKILKPIVRVFFNNIKRQRSGEWRLRVFHVFQFVLYSISLIQTYLLATSSVPTGVVVFEWFLLAAFWMESWVYNLVFSEKTIVEQRFISAMNISMFIALCFLTSSMNFSRVSEKYQGLDEGALTSVLIIQSIRFLRLILTSKPLRPFVSILPVLARVVLVYALILYSFAVLGHITLCHVIDSSAINSVDADDDSAAWLTFSKLLNFNSFYSSYYTVAVSAVLSNWSMVMDAAIASAGESEKNWIYLYFFFFRVSTVVLVIPLLLSCVIQTFIQYLDKVNAEKMLLKQQEQEDNEKRMSSMNGSSSTVDNTKAANEEEDYAEEAEEKDEVNSMDGSSEGSNNDTETKKEQDDEEEDDDDESNEDEKTDEKRESEDSKAANGVKRRDSASNRRSSFVMNFKAPSSTEVRDSTRSTMSPNMSITISQPAVHGTAAGITTVQNRKSRFKSRGSILGLDYFHLTTKRTNQSYAVVDSIATLWSTSGRARIFTGDLTSNFSKKYSNKNNVSNTKFYNQMVKLSNKMQAQIQIVETLPLPAIEQTSKSEPIPSTIRFELHEILVLDKLKNWMKEFQSYQNYAAKTSSTSKYAKKSAATAMATDDFQYVGYTNSTFKLIRTNQLLKGIRERMPIHCYGRLCAIWFSDALTGLEIHYPHTEKQLWYLRVLKNKFFIGLLGAIVFIQMIAIFLIVPYCQRNEQDDANGGTNVITHYGLDWLDLICAIIYMLEIGLDVAANRDSYIYLFCRWSPVELDHLYASNRSMSTTLRGFGKSMILQEAYVSPLANSGKEEDNQAKKEGDQQRKSKTPITTEDISSTAKMIKKAINGNDVQLAMAHSNVLSQSVLQFYRIVTHWLVIRFGIIFLVFLKAFMGVVAPDNRFSELRIIRCVFPYLFLVHHTHFLDMLIGLYHSLYRTRMVYGLFGSMVVIFSIIGYFQFHRFHTTAGRFQDISTSIKTILQVSTSAPFSLYVLLPYYETVSQISPLFFLVITYLVESLCIPLIVGAGNVFFNKYGNAVLKRRRKKRYEAFLHIWILLTKSTKLQAFKADNVSSTEHVEPRVSFIAFQDFIASLPRKYLLPRDVISELLVFIRRQILTDENTSKKGNKLEAEETLSKEEFFALLGCVYHGITITNFAEIHSDATADNTSTKALNNNSMNVFRDSLFYDIRYLSSKPSSASFSSSKGTAMELQDRKSTHAISSNEIAEVQNPMLSSPSVANDSSSSKTPTTWSDWVKGLDDHVQVLMVKEDTVTSFVSGYLFPSIQGNDFIQKLRDTCHQMVYTTVRLGKYENYDYSFSVLDLFTALIHFLLIIQLIYYTALYLSTGQYRAMAGFGYFLEACIVLELLIRIIGIGDRHFFHYEQAHVARVCLAFIVIVCMIALGNKGYIFTHNDVDDNGSNVRVNISSYYLFLVLAQCLNLGLALLVIRPHSHNVEVVNTILEQQLTVHKEKATVDGNGDDATSLAMPKSHINSNYWLYRNHHIRTGLSSSIANRRLRMSVENAFRSIFLLFIVLYFFTIIAQDLFCGVLDPDQIVGSPTNDDDASSWNNFANILNFNSYQQTFFTLFEVTVLGSWSMVMDATVYNSQNKSFVLLFFFGFRFLMTLVVLPLLMSFMVRTFIALNDQISYIHKRRRKFTNLMKEEEKHEIVRLSQMMESSPSLSMPSLSEGNLDMTNVSFSSSVNESMIANKKEGKVASNPLFACVQFCQDVYTGRALRYNHPCIIKYQAAVAYLDIWDLATLHDLDVVSIQDPLFVRTFLTLENGYWKLKQLVTRLEEYLRRLQLQEEIASRSGEEGSGVDGGSPLASDIAALRQIIQESNELLSKIDPIFRVITNAKK